MSLGRIIEQIHYKCRNSVYPRSSCPRLTVPDDKVHWSIEWADYKPNIYTAPVIKNQPWADPDLEEASFKPIWNALDSNVDRRSHTKQYNIVSGCPLNPIGRTGIAGRGVLGRWGPNHAADPILTRWKRNSGRVVEYDKVSNKPILQFVGIERRDCKEWAIPGGMVDPGETVSATLKREFMEEALNVLADSEEERKRKEKLMEKFFSNGVEIYKGYVDDPRNTDNAWMETVATNFHDDDGKFVEEIDLHAGDDASNVRWIDIHSGLNLYASHLDFIFKVTEIRNSHW